MRLFRRGEPASTLDLLVAGLGNPGREYADTRHNVGFMVADALARRHGGSWRGKFSGELAEIRADGLRLALLKPQTYMNESGRSIGAAARFPDRERASAEGQLRSRKTAPEKASELNVCRLDDMLTIKYPVNSVLQSDFRFQPIPTDIRKR